MTPSNHHAANMAETSGGAARPSSTRAIRLDLSAQVPAANFDEWAARVMLNMQRMSVDEAYRLEIAKRLS